MDTWLKRTSLGVISDCMNVIVYYGYIYIIGLSATSQEMLSTAQGAEKTLLNGICVVLQVYPKPLSWLHIHSPKLEKVVFWGHVK